MPALDAYDELAYGDLTFHDTHPGQIAAIAAIAGHAAPPVDTCRVLELGCGTGFNLLAMSQSLPNAHFTGIDLSAPQIARAQSVAASIGARNVVFHCQSIDAMDFEPASFDYIIAHGVYSWVPDFIRTAILSEIDRLLSPNGIAYVSYNTYPGWRLCGMVRDALKHFIDPSQPYIAQIPKVRAEMDRLLASLAEPESNYANALRTVWQTIAPTPDFYIAHEYLAGENTPFFFRDFAVRAATHNLQFLGEARFVSNVNAQNEETSEAIAAAGDNILDREQRLDFLTGRFFRQTLLCRANVELDRNTDPTALLDLNVSGSVEILDRGDNALRVRQIWGKEAEITDDACMAVIRALEPFGVRPVPARELEPAILGALGMDAMRGFVDPVVGSILWAGWRNGFWALRADTPAMTHELSAAPVACPLARLQAASSNEPTSRLHRPVRMTPEECELLQRLDGSQPVAKSAALERFAAAGLLIA